MNHSLTATELAALHRAVIADPDYLDPATMEIVREEWATASPLRAL